VATLRIRYGAQQEQDNSVKGGSLPLVLERSGYIQGTLLLAQFLGLFDLFVRLFFLWRLGRFFFRGFLRVLVFTHDFLRLSSIKKQQVTSDCLQFQK
jgi:hypothetical protein